NREPKLFANMLGSVATGFQDAELVRLRTEWHVHSSSPDELLAYNAANEHIDVTDVLPRLGVPTLVIHERAFPFGSFELCQDVDAGIRGAQLLIVRDPSIAGRLHDETVAGIDRFLRGVTAGDTSPHTPSGAGGDRSAPNGLTPRELQILRQVAAGSTNKEIARKFGLAVSTVV